MEIRKISRRRETGISWLFSDYKSRLQTIGEEKNSCMQFKRGRYISIARIVSENYFHVTVLN